VFGQTTKPTTCYQVRLWNAHYEVAQTRRCVTATWFANPNKHEGRGFDHIARHKDGGSIYGCWKLILELASKAPINRGVLEDWDGAYSFEDMAYKTRFPVGLFSMAVPILCDPAIRWMEDKNAPGAMLGEIKGATAGGKRQRQGFTKDQQHTRAVELVVDMLTNLRSDPSARSRYMKTVDSKFEGLGVNGTGLSVKEQAREIFNAQLRD